MTERFILPWTSIQQELTNPTTHVNRISEATALNLIDKYFQDVAAYFNNYNQVHGTSYQIGVYGAGDTLAQIVSDPLVRPAAAMLLPG